MINRIASTTLPARGDVRRDAFVEDVVKLLVSRYQPSRVFLFGSRVRGDFTEDSDYDFLIEVAEIPKDDSGDEQRMLLFHHRLQHDVHVHVRLPGELESNADDLGGIEWDVVREGVLLHGSATSPTRTPGVVRERKRPRSDPVKHWRRLADRDLYAAEKLGERPREFEEIICFHCQQAAEKYLKALILQTGTRPIRTHKLVDLLAQLTVAGFDFRALVDDGKYLSRFAVEPRYPTSMKFDTERALAAARRIAAAVDEGLRLG